LRFDPALAPALLGEMSTEKREAARAAWTKAVAAEIDFLYQKKSKNANLSANLCLLDLANLLAALEHSAKGETPERVVDLATSLEALVAPLNRPNALARAVAIRAAATQRLGGWSNARFVAEGSAIERLVGQGEYAKAANAARSLLQRAEQAGDAAYPGAAYDCAIAQTVLGRALQMGGAAAEAVPHLDQARRAFEALGETGMANVALGDLADCLTDLGRYDEAAASYEEVIAAAEQLDDQRTVGVGKTQLATARLRQRRYTDALALYHEVLGIFKALGEARSVAVAWHQIGWVHQEASQPDDAERAYQESLKIKVEIGDARGENNTLTQLGNLYSLLGRREDAVRCYRQAVDVDVRLSDLRGEGIDRNNLAVQLIALNRYDEARPELERAVECKRPFGHVAEPWKTFDVLSDLERAVGNAPAAQDARAHGVEAYLAYRRDGGAPQNRRGELLASDPAGLLAALQQAPDLSPVLRALIAPLQAILGGSRDTNFADDLDLPYRDAAELLLLVERAAGATAG
jgi:tetratricopeptide (TPR) repeat protein